MSPQLAATIFAIGIAGLFFLDTTRFLSRLSPSSWSLIGDKKVSKALWIPTLWLFFCLSRSASLWLGTTSPTTDMASAYLEGSPIDRALFIGLEVAALIIVISRGRRVGTVLLQNWPICLFFLYAALSITWSDYPFVTLKHWIKGIGDLMMMLIVLTEQNVPEAIKRLFTRLGFVLVPLSVLFIKYYPQLGRLLNLSWEMEPIGVATQKNGLGELCDFLGLALLWRLRSAYNDREDPNRKRRLLALGAVLAMVIWLLWTCNSMTSICALSMASMIMFLSTRPAFRRRPASVHFLIVALLSCTVYALFFESSGSLIAGLGRNPTLTGRTDIWHAALTVRNSPLVGAGYESFWLGTRLQEMWKAIPGLRVNEAHNGYIEIVLTLGYIGAILLGILIVTGYRNIIADYRSHPEIASLRMAFLFAAVTNALTEAAFRMMGPPWIAFLLAIMAVPVCFAPESGGSGRQDGQLSRPARAGDIAVPELVLTDC
jgi:exopolysaccharide production protein ExoQ